MAREDQLIAELAAFTVRLERRLAGLEAEIETTRRLALDALDLLTSDPHDLARAAGNGSH